MPVTEQDALFALQSYDQLETDEDKSRAFDIFTAYEDAQKAAGKELYPEFNRKKREQVRALRTPFQDRESFGFDQETLSKFRETIGQSEAGPERYFLNKYLAHTYGESLDTVRRDSRLFLKDFTQKEFGADLDYVEAFEALGNKFNRQESRAAFAYEKAMQGLTPEQMLRKYTEENDDPDIEDARKEFASVASEIGAKVRPYEGTINNILYELERVMVEEVPQDEDGTVSENESKSDDWFIDRMLEVPHEDRELVLQALMIRASATAEAAEAVDPKSTAKRVAERFGRQVGNIQRGVTRTFHGRRSQLDGIARSILANGLPEGVDPSDFSELDQAATAQIVDESSSSFTGEIPREGSAEFEALAPDVQTALTEIQRQQDAITLYDQLNNIATNGLDPAKGRNIAENFAVGFSSMTPNLVIMAAGPIGAAMNVGYYMEDSTASLLRDNPEMSISDATSIGAVGGIAMGMLDKIPLRVLQGKTPGLNRWLNRHTVTTSGRAGRFGARATVGAGAEFAQELAQEMATPALQDLVSALNEDIPEVDWDQQFGEFFSDESLSELIPTIIGLSIIGAGVGSVRDMRDSRGLLASSDALRLIPGISEADSLTIASRAKQGDWAGAESLFREKFNSEEVRASGLDQKTPREQRIELAKKQVREADDLRERIAEGSEIGILPEYEVTADGFLIRFNDGTENTYATPSEAIDAQFQYARDRRLKLHATIRQAIAASESGLELGRSVKFIFDPRARTLLDEVRDDDVNVTREQALERISIADNFEGIDIDEEYRIHRSRGTIEEADEDALLASYTVLGKNSTEFAEGVARTTARLFQGASALTVIEEKAEGDAAALLEQDRVNGNTKQRDFLIEKVRGYEQLSGQKVFAEEDDEKISSQAIKEAYSDLVTFYYAGENRATQDAIVNSGLATQIGMYGEYFESVFRRAEVLNNLKAEGKIDSELETMLARSVGISEQMEFDSGVIEEAEANLSDWVDPDSVAFDESKIDPEAGFSVARRDSEYLAAVESGDMETAQRMVDEAAKAAGGVGPVKRGDGKSFNIFDKSRRGESTKAASAKKAFFFTETESAAQTFGWMSANNEAEIAMREEQEALSTRVDELFQRIAEDISPEFLDAAVSLDILEQRGANLLSKVFIDGKKALLPMARGVLSKGNLADPLLLRLVNQQSGGSLDEKSVEEWSRLSSQLVSASSPQWLSYRERKKKELGLEERGIVRDFYLFPGTVQEIDYGGKSSREGPITYSAAIDQAIKRGDGGVTFRNTRDAGEVIDIHAVFSPNQIKSADPVTYDADGAVIPLSKRFDNSRPEISFSVIKGDIDQRVAEMFSPFVRQPELRREIGKRAREKAIALLNEWRPVIEANRTDREISAEQKAKQDEIFSDKLESLSSTQIAALDAAESLSDPASRPILSELLTRQTYTRKDGKAVSMWRGSLMSKTEAQRRGFLSVAEWDDMPEGLPPYVWGGSITPDQAATQFGFESVAEFWSALESEIESYREVKRAAEDAQKDIRGLERDAAKEAEEFAEQLREERRTVGTDRNVLIGALKTLDGIVSTLPPEVRGKIGGYTKLATLKSPEAMLKEIERRVRKIDGELEFWLNKEVEEGLNKLFRKIKKSEGLKPGERPNGKYSQEFYDLANLAKEAQQQVHADDVEAEAQKLDIDAEKARSADTTGMSPDEILALEEKSVRAELSAEVVRSFGGWNMRTVADKQHALDLLESLYNGAVFNARTREAERREWVAGQRESLRGDTGKSGKAGQRDIERQSGAGVFGKARDFALSLLNFEQLSKWTFGDGSETAAWFADQQREAENRKVDAVHDTYDAVEDFFTELGKGRLAGQKLQHRMSSDMAIEAKTATGDTRKLTQMEAVSVMLMWQQEDGRRHMQGRRDEETGAISSEWSYDQEFVDEVARQMSDEAWAFLAFLQRQYREEYPGLNAVYRELYGVDLPSNPNYSPLTVQPFQNQKNETVDPTTGTTMSGGSMTPGSLRTRSTAIAEPNFRDALATFLAHKKQIEHWKAYASFTRDARAVLGNREVLNSVKAAHGEQAAHVLGKWIDLFQDGGARDASAGLSITGALQNMVNNAQGMALIGRIGTLIIQSTQLSAASARMPAGAYLSRLSKLLGGQLEWGAALNSPYIQRRLREQPAIVQQAMEGLRSGSPTAFREAQRRLGSLIGGADALFTAGTYAIVYDYQLSKLGDAKTAAAETERIVDEIAQPTRSGTRSYFEAAATNPIAKLAWAFGSEARKNLGLMIYSAARRKGIEGARAIFWTVVTQGVFSTLIRNAWRDLRDDNEEDDTYWDPRRMALVSTTDWLFGFPVVGEAIQDAIFTAAGEFRFDSGLLDSGSDVAPASRRLLSGNSDDLLRDVEKIVTGIGLAEPRYVAPTASFLHVIRDLFNLGKNATQ